MPVKPSPVRVKVPMVAMTVSCLSIGPRPSRPRWRSSGRGRAPTHSAGAAAQRRTGLGDFLASRGMAHPGSPRGLPRGVGSQGKKVAPAPLRPRRPRRQPSLGQIRPSEAAWQRDTGRTGETAGDGRLARHKRDGPVIAVTAPMACTREDPAGTGEARCWTGDPSSRLGGAWRGCSRRAPPCFGSAARSR